MKILKIISILIILGVKIFSVENADNKSGSLELGVRSAIELIRVGKINDAMNAIRKGINVSYYDRLHVDQEVVDALAVDIKNEKINDNKAALLVVMAVALVGNGEMNYDKIISTLEDAKKYNDKLPEIYNLMGIMYYLKGESNVNKCIQEYTIAIKLNDHYLDALENRAKAYRFINRNDLAVLDMALVQDLKNSLYYQSSKESTESGK